MRICVLTHTFPRFPGDTISSIFMSELAQSLVDNGNEVWVLTPFTSLFRKSKKPYKIITYKYIFPDSLHKLGYSETLSNDMGLPVLMWFLSPFMYFFGFLALIRLVQKEKIELINAHWILPNGFIAGAVSLFTGVPVVSTLPGSDVYMAKKNILFNLLARFATWKSKWITSNSGQLITDLGLSTHIDLKEKSSTLVYGIGSNLFKPTKSDGAFVRKELHLSPKNIVVLGVGRLVAKKGFRYLIKAAPKIIKKHPKVFFVLIGDGEERNYLEKLVKNIKAEKHFKFLGNISYTKMNKYYNAADIFILPSVRDKKGNLDDQSVAVMDAMVCGKPVITSDFPGYRVVIQDRKTGILVKEKHVAGIENAVNTLIASKKFREKMGLEARKFVLKNFTWKAIGGQYSNLFKKLISKPTYSQSIPIIKNVKGREKKARQIIQVLKAHLKNIDNLKCLDVGSSAGVISNYLAQYFKEVTAIDVDNFAIELATREYKRKNLMFLQMPGEDLKFKNNSFDVVIANQIYDFVDDPDKTFSEIFRVLKKGGICFFGARNKYTLIEAQYHLPFLSFLPKSISDKIVILSGKGNEFIGNYKSYWQLKNLVKKFSVDDYTLKILREPKIYGYNDLVKYKKITKMLPLELMLPLLPNFIWILKKTS